MFRVFGVCVCVWKEVETDKCVERKLDDRRSFKLSYRKVLKQKLGNEKRGERGKRE